MATIGDLLTSALRELGIVDLTDTPGAELSTLALGVLNRLIEEWNGDGRALYADVHSSLLPFTANLNPHTIGITGNAPTWTVTVNRPVQIHGIRITTDNGETFLEPLTPRPAEWWHALGAPGTTSAYPTDFYFNPTWPNGSIYFYPEPSSAAVKAQVWYRAPLASVVAGDTLTLPPGYHSALLETVKERISRMPMFRASNHPEIAEAARVARAAAWGTDDAPKSLVTADAGMSVCGAPGVYDAQLGPYSLMRWRR